MRAYLDLLDEALSAGAVKSDRTGTGVKSLFGRQMRFDLREGFPLVTTKRLHLKSIVHELIWFLRGDTNVAYLQANGVRIWDEWADESGRSWSGLWQAMARMGGGGRARPRSDRLGPEGDRRNPDSRRLIVSAWNVADIGRMKLAPCHCLFQFYVADGRLSCQLYQRSADLFLGVPFNIASYALLTHLIAQASGLGVGDFVHTFGDAHLYLNHLDQAREQLTRTPRALPRLKLDPARPLFSAQGESLAVNLRAEDIAFEGYDPWPAIKAQVAV